MTLTPEEIEEATEEAVEKLLQKESELRIQNYLAPDLTGDWEGG